MQNENNLKKSKTGSGKYQHISEKDKTFTIDKINIQSNMNELGTN